MAGDTGEELKLHRQRGPFRVTRQNVMRANNPENLGNPFGNHVRLLSGVSQATTTMFARVKQTLRTVLSVSPSFHLGYVEI